MQFHQTLVFGVVEVADDLVRFWRSWVQGQGRYKVRRKKIFGKPYLLIGLKDFDQILHKYSIQWLDELITFWRSWVKVKVTTRSNIWVNYCDGWRHPNRRLGVEVSPSFPNCSVPELVGFGLSSWFVTYLQALQLRNKCLMRSEKTAMKINESAGLKFVRNESHMTHTAPALLSLAE